MKKLIFALLTALMLGACNFNVTGSKEVIVCDSYLKGGFYHEKPTTFVIEGNYINYEPGSWNGIVWTSDRIPGYEISVDRASNSILVTKDGTQTLWFEEMNKITQIR